jgi:hypothetical protein
MGNRQVPIFTGPQAERAARVYARYDFATRILESIETIGDQLRFRVIGNPQLVELIDIEGIEILPASMGSWSRDDLFTFLSKIDGIGPTIANTLVSKYGTIDSLLVATVEDLDKLPFIGEKRAYQILSNIKRFYQNSNKWTLSKLR